MDQQPGGRMMRGLHFNAERHEYTYDGRRAPSVTELLAELYDWSGIPQAALEFAKERGSAVHKACELHDLGTLDPDSVDEVVAPYLKAWQKFLDDTGFAPRSIEQPLYNSVAGFAGTPDRDGKFYKLIGSPTAVVDIKAVSKISPVTGVQLAGYKRLLSANGIDVEQRYAVQLLPTGNYRLHQFIDPYDDACFVAQLTTYAWRQKYGKS